MPIEKSTFKRDKFYQYAWSLLWMLTHGKTEEQAVASLKKRFKWLSDEVIDIALGRARKWIKNADAINAAWKAAEMREQQQ